MDARDDRLDERLSELGEAIHKAVGTVDVEAAWQDLQKRRRSTPPRRRRPGWWVGAAATLAAILIAAPYLMHLRANPSPTTRTAKISGKQISISAVSAVDFITTQDGWAAVRLGKPGARSAVLSTANGGRNWSLHELPRAYQGFSVAGIHLTDEQHGELLVWEDGLTAAHTGFMAVAILSTEDGGQHWHVAYRSKLSATAIGTERFQFFGAVGYTFDGQLLRSSDGGSAWTTVTLPKGFTPSHVDFLSAQVGFVAGEVCPATPQTMSSGQGSGCRPDVITTRDGGTTWSTAFMAPPVEGGAYSLVSFVNAEDGWYYVQDTATYRSYLYRTIDGGRSWTVEQPNFAQGLVGRVPPQDMTFITPQIGWAPLNSGPMGLPAGLLVTRDGGKTWTVVGDQWSWSLNAVSLLSESVGFAAGDNGDLSQGFLVKTTDGGQTWTQLLPSLTPTGMVDFVGARHGFGVGSTSDPRALLITSDGGTSWFKQSELPANPLGLSFVKVQIGHVVVSPRSGGATTVQILRTTDGGRNWHVQAQLATPWPWGTALPYVKFFDQSHGVLVLDGPSRSVLKETNDGGTTWRSISTRTTGSDEWSQFSFLSPRVGYMLTTKLGHGATGTDEMTLQETKDGGRTWRAVYHLSGHEGEGISFISPSEGWIAISAASTTRRAKTVIMRTTDGGRTWSRYEIAGHAIEPIGNSLRLQFQDSTHGWMMGLDGFYSTTDGGKSWTHQP